MPRVAKSRVYEVITEPPLTLAELARFVEVAREAGIPEENIINIEAIPGGGLHIRWTETEGGAPFKPWHAGDVLTERLELPTWRT